MDATLYKYYKQLIVKTDVIHSYSINISNGVLLRIFKVCCYLKSEFDFLYYYNQ